MDNKLNEESKRRDGGDYINKRMAGLCGEVQGVLTIETEN